MDFNQFVDEVKGGIKLFLPREYENAQVRIEEVRKLNENYLGITVLKENQIMAPTFNLNQLYEMYQSNPEVSMEDLYSRKKDLYFEADLHMETDENGRVTFSLSFPKRKTMKKNKRK